MYKLLFSLTILAFNYLILQGQVNHTIHLANCSITAPDTLSYSLEEVKTKIGTIDFHRYRHNDTIQGKIIKYIFQYCDYPDNTFHSDSTDLLDSFFEITAESSASIVLGKLEYSQTIDLHGYPGMVWRISFDSDKALIKSYAFIKNDRFYNISVHYPRDLGHKKSIDTFFDSFRLLE